MKHLTIIAVIAASVLVVWGCKSKDDWSYNFNFEKRYITVITEPEGASVVQIDVTGDSTLLGKTPCTEQPVVVVTKITKAENLTYESARELTRRVDNVLVVVQKEGYQTYRGYLRTDPEQTLTHEITLQPEQ